LSISSDLWGRRLIYLVVVLGGFGHHIYELDKSFILRCLKVCGLITRSLTRYN